MTTIAYDGRYLVADGQISCGDIIVETDRVKFIVDEKYGVFCFTAAMDELPEFIDCVKTFIDNPNHKIQLSYFLDCECVLVDKDKRVWQFAFTKNEITNLFVIWKCEINRKSFALGSGKRYAYTAMDCGLNAIRAVEKASLRDLYTGGKIKAYDVLEQRFLDENT